MQIVIDIPEDLRKMIFDKQMFDIAHSYRLAKCISEGTPLPKGHGAIVDMNQLNMWDVRQTPIIIPAEEVEE